MYAKESWSDNKTQTMGNAEDVPTIIEINKGVSDGSHRAGGKTFVSVV